MWPSQIEDHLEKDNREWLAGGTEPTLADFQMIFALDWWLTLDSNALGPKTRAYVKRIHAR